MLDKKIYKETFSTLHASSDTLEEVHKMIEKKEKRIYAKRTIAAAASAIVCFIIIGCLVFNPSTTNEFTINCYAIDEDEDGQPAMRQLNDGALVLSDAWLGYVKFKGNYIETREDTASLYIDVGWQIEGENIKTVELTVEDGYFLNRLGLYEFEEIGNSVVLDKGDVHKGDVLYVGYELDVTYVEKEVESHGENAVTGETWEQTTISIEPEYESIDEIVLHAVVTYDNGETEEKDMIFETPEWGFQYTVIFDLEYYE